MRTAQRLENWTAHCGLIQKMSWSCWMANSSSSGSLRKTSSILRRKILSLMSESWWTNHLRLRSCAMTTQIRGQSRGQNHGAMSRSCCQRCACRRHRGHDHDHDRYRDSRCCPGAWVDGHTAVLCRVVDLSVDTSVDISGGVCRDTCPVESSRSPRDDYNFRGRRNSLCVCV